MRPVCFVVAGEVSVGRAIASRFTWGGYDVALMLEEASAAAPLTSPARGPERHITPVRALPDDADGLLDALDEARLRVGPPRAICLVPRPADGAEPGLVDRLDAIAAGVACATLLAKEAVARMAREGGGCLLLVPTDGDLEARALEAVVLAVRRSRHAGHVAAELVRAGGAFGPLGLPASAADTAPDYADACWRAGLRAARPVLARDWLN